jgi:hypothetical protein
MDDARASHINAKRGTIRAVNIAKLLTFPDSPKKNSFCSIPYSNLKVVIAFYNILILPGHPEVYVVRQYVWTS